MKIPQSQIMLVEALLDGELKGQELLSALRVLSSSPELKHLYDTLKEQQESIRQAFFLTRPPH